LAETSKQKIVSVGSSSFNGAAAIFYLGCVKAVWLVAILSGHSVSLSNFLHVAFLVRLARREIVCDLFAEN
jgi:hypothetical protein